MSSDDDGPDVSFQSGFGDDGELEVGEQVAETDLTDWGVESDDREQREARDDVARATTFGVDDRPESAVETRDVETDQATLGDGRDADQATLGDPTPPEDDE